MIMIMIIMIIMIMFVMIMMMIDMITQIVINNHDENQGDDSHTIYMINSIGLITIYTEV